MMKENVLTHSLAKIFRKGNASSKCGFNAKQDNSWHEDGKVKITRGKRIRRCGF